MFKEFIENETKFKYVEKLFFLELEVNQNDQNIQNFVSSICANKKVKESFLTVKHINSLLPKIDKEAKYNAAKVIRNYKRCIFNTEDTYRANLNLTENAGKGFLEVLEHDAT